MKFGENWYSDLEKLFKHFMILYTYIAQKQGQITPEGINFVDH